MPTLRKLLLYPGIVGQVLYLFEALRARMGFWPLLAMGVPLLLLERTWNKPPDPRGARWDLLGAGWYLALTGYSVYLAVSGYRPENWILFLLLMAPGALLCMMIIVRVLRASSEGPGSGTDSQVPSNKPMEAP
jgi:hypothetical protein